MVGFSTKTIENPPSLGERLRARREQLRLTIEMAARAVKVPARYLVAIESGSFNELPGEVYGKNFVRAYAGYLGLECQEYIDLYRTHHAVYRKTKKDLPLDIRKPVERISRIHLIVTPRLIRNAALGLMAFACLMYLGVKIKGVVTPPVLVVEQPTSNVVTTEPFINIQGYAERDTTLAINGQQVLADNNGVFTETLELQSGVNVIEIVANKRHGKQTKVYRQVVVTEPSANSADEQVVNN